MVKDLGTTLGVIFALVCGIVVGVVSTHKECPTCPKVNCLTPKDKVERAWKRWRDRPNTKNIEALGKAKIDLLNHQRRKR